MKTLIALLVILLAVLVEIPVGLMLFKIWPLHLFWGILCHLVSAALCTAGLYLLERVGHPLQKRRNLWCIFGLVMCLTLPVYGIVAVLFIYLGQRWRKKHPPPILSDDITVQDASMFTRHETHVKQIEVLNLLDVEPLIDVFRSNKTDLKISAVKILGTLRTKRALTTLMQALLDEDIEVRLFAAGIIGSIEDDYARGIDKRKRELAADPGNRDLALKLANYYLSYAKSGLFDRVASTFYDRSVIDVLNTIPEDAEVNYVKSQSHIILGEFDEAMKCIDKSLKTDPANVDYEFTQWRILYEMHDYIILAARAHEVLSQDTHEIDPDVLAYWTGHDARTTHKPAQPDESPAAE